MNPTRPMKHLSRALAFLLLLLPSSCWLPPAHAAESLQYDYDPLGRLVGVRFANGLSLQYVYDDAGNLLAKRIGAAVDSDGDGMDDAWENAFFQTLARDGSADFDRDGANDLAEFMAGTDPISATSVLRVSRIDRPAENRLRLDWASIPGRRYRIQFKDTVTAPAWTTLPGETTATSSTTTATVDAPSAPAYYRILLAP
jgi:YD repeat-containing protein